MYSVAGGAAAGGGATCGGAAGGGVSSAANAGAATTTPPRINKANAEAFIAAIRNVRDIVGGILLFARRAVRIGWLTG
jgi:hypothetical protein